MKKLVNNKKQKTQNHTKNNFFEHTIPKQKEKYVVKALKIDIIRKDLSKDFNRLIMNLTSRYHLVKWQ